MVSLQIDLWPRQALVPRPLVEPMSCGAHGMLHDEKLWVFKPLQEREFRHNDEFFWDEKQVFKVLSSVHAAHNPPVLNGRRIWSTIERPGLFWTGNPYNRDTCPMWASGWWPQSNKMTRSLQFGCLKCGCRTPDVKPWAPRSPEYGDRNGSTAVNCIIEALFGDL